MCKGADTSILSRLDERVYKSDGNVSALRIKSHVLKKMHKYACKGYRALLMGMRVLSAAELGTVQREYSQILEMDLDAKKLRYKQFLTKLESDLFLIGGSAVEDRLQEDLKDTIQSLRNAQMKIWVLTGDKMETAENIAISSGLFDIVAPTQTCPF